MINITDLYEKDQEKLYGYVRDFVKTKAIAEAFDVFTIEEKMFIALTPKNAEKPYPVLASHLDIKYSTPPEEIREKMIGDRNYYVGYRDGYRCILSGDDRNGVWTMLNLLENGYHGWGYIFTKDEEIRRKGAIALRASGLLDTIKDQIGYFIQIDRCGTGDLAWYPLINEAGFTHQNEEFIKQLQQLEGFTTKQGRSTDVREYCTATHTCGINISAGYFDEHTEEEHSDIEYVESLPATIQRLVELLGYRRYEIDKSFPVTPY